MGLKTIKKVLKSHFLKMQRTLKLIKYGENKAENNLTL